MQRKEQGAQTRTALIAAARRLYRSGGLSALALDGVAKEAGTSKSSIFWHFANKEDLLFTVVDTALEEWERTAREALLVAPDPKTRLTVLLGQYSRLTQEFRDIRRLMVGLLIESTESASEVRDRYQRVYQGYLKTFESILDDGVQQGQFSLNNRPDETARIILAMIDGLFIQLCLDPQQKTEELFSCATLHILSCVGC